MTANRQAIHQDDDVDTLVEALIDDPTKADDVKAALRRKIRSTDVIRLDARRSTAERQGRNPDLEDDETDLWDNVPV